MRSRSAMPTRLRPAALGVVAKQQSSLHLAADAAQRRGGEDAFGRAARTDIHVDPGLGVRGCDHAADIAIRDQGDAGAGGAQLGDQIGVARPIEDAHDEVADLDVFRLGQVAQVRRRLFVEIDEIVGQPPAHRDLVHINVGRVEKTAGIGHRDHRQRIGAALGGDRRPFERVEGDVDRRAVSGADLLADVEHRRLVALAFADHDRAVDGERIERRAHRVDRGLVGRLFVTPPHQPRGREGRRLGHPDGLQCEVAIHLRCLGHGFPPGPRPQSISRPVARAFCRRRARLRLDVPARAARPLATAGRRPAIGRRRKAKRRVRRRQSGAAAAIGTSSTAKVRNPRCGSSAAARGRCRAPRSCRAPGASRLRP